MKTSNRPAAMAGKILDVLIDSGLAVGERLVENTLAEACHVSRTPIRNALQLLEQQGYASKAPEGGYVLARDPLTVRLDADIKTDPPEGVLVERVVRDRASRRLGASVTVSELSRRYNVPRAAAQNLLLDLKSKGIVDKADGQSWMFKQLMGEQSSQAHSFEFRLMLEPEAILSEGFRIEKNRAAVVRLQTEDLLARAENAIRLDEFRNADLAFHLLIARAVTNPYISETMTNHNQLRHLHGASHTISDFRMRQSLREHLRILDALEQGMPAVAADLMRVHLRMSKSNRPSVANRGAPAIMLAGRMQRT